MKELLGKPVADSIVESLAPEVAALKAKGNDHTTVLCFCGDGQHG